MRIVMPIDELISLLKRMPSDPLNQASEVITDLLTRVKELEVDLADQKPYKDLLRDIDRLFGCEHVDKGPDDAQEVVRHVKELQGELAKAKKDGAAAWDLMLQRTDERDTCQIQLHQRDTDVALMKEECRVSDEGFNFHLKRANDLMNQVNQLNTALVKCREAMSRIGGTGWKYPFDHFNGIVSDALSTIDHALSQIQGVSNDK